MRAEYITLDHPRVKLQSTRVGRIYTLDGATGTTLGGREFRYTENGLGQHQEPRMSSVMTSSKSFNLHPGDFAEIELEGIPLLGIALELAEHHYDVDIFIDGEKIYGEFYCLSDYVPSSDGFGKIHWLMMDRARHIVRLEVSQKYNRMLDLTGTEPTHACLSGFILKPEMDLPPPVYTSWMFTQDSLTSAYHRIWNSEEANRHEGTLQVHTIPPGGYLYLMDLYGQGTLETLTFHVDGPVALEIIDGGVAQPEYPFDFPSWLRRVDLGQEDSGALATVVHVDRTSGDPDLGVRMLKPLTFGSRLLIRLYNGSEHEHRISRMYMEGTLKCT